MGNLSGFDASTVEPNEGYTAIPAGEYQAIIADSKMKSTKAGDGQYLELKLQVLNGKYQNRTLFDRLNLHNKNSQAVEIAKGTLSAICRAVGVIKPDDSAELHNKPMMITVKVKEDNQGNPRNEISGYKPRQTASNMVADAFNSDVEDDYSTPF